MTQDLDERLRAYYRAQRLPPEHVHAIACRTPAGPRRRWAAAAAAMLLFAAVLTSLVWWQSTPSTPTDPLVADLVRNHTGTAAGDFSAYSIAALEEALRKAGTGIEVPRSLPFGRDIDGARLCSVLGQPAIHLALESEPGEGRRSLFIAADRDALAERTAAQFSYNQVRMRTWSENNHFYALVEEKS